MSSSISHSSVHIVVVYGWPHYKLVVEWHLYCRTMLVRIATRVLSNRHRMCIRQSYGLVSHHLQFLPHYFHLIGEYYKFDESTSGCHDSVMADQLCGIWYLGTCRLTDAIEVINSNKNKDLCSGF